MPDLGEKLQVSNIGHFGPNNTPLGFIQNCIGLLVMECSASYRTIAICNVGTCYA